MSDPVDSLDKTLHDGTRVSDGPSDETPLNYGLKPEAPSTSSSRPEPARAQGPGPSPATPASPKPSSNLPWLFVGVGAVLIGLACFVVASATHSAAERLAAQADEARPAVAIADQAEVAYCTPEFKRVLERVLHACGLDGGNSRHGCQPSDVKSFASISDEDFNALFTPLKDRGAVLLFDNNSEELDAAAKQLLDERFADRRGARYFFAVARASKSGNQAKNRALSHRRANSVKFHVAEVSPDPDLDRKFGQLWLGNEFAQLSQNFCDWPSSRPDQKCSTESINRSVFVSWVDCRL
jgi:outer membrane protein OmpA-like peptidoglycan-associated protein